MPRPNTRMQRTRSSPSAHRSPLTRYPLGGLWLVWRIALVALQLSVSPAAGAQESGGDGMILYGKDFAFIASPPAGWIGKGTPGDSDGMAALYYPKGSTWQDSSSVMYITVSEKNDSDAKDLAQFMNGEIARFREHNPKLVVKSLKALPTHSGKTAEVRQLSGDQWANRELVAYLEEKSVFMIFVLSARSETILKASEPAFRELLAGYFFLTENVQLPPSKK